MADENRINVLLEEFKKQHRINSKGALSTVLTLTRNAQQQEFPLSPEDFRTGRKGQVAGLGGPVVRSILKKHGIERTLAEEGGRTSRGSMELMEKYIDLLNTLAQTTPFDLLHVEKWWVDRVREYFASQPIRIKADISKSMRLIVAELQEAALARQKEYAGTMIVGAVLEHLVGAKLTIALSGATITHKSFSTADASSRAKGDFLISDTAIHVTTAPVEALIRKCAQNIAEGLRPLIVTSENGVGGVRALAENAGIAERIDVLEIGQFLTTNIYEWIGFDNRARTTSMERLISVYNGIIDQCETDPSLKIELG